MKKKTIREYYQIPPQYIEEIYFLQVELLKLQKHIHQHKMRVAILFEGRDTAGKGSAIFRFTQFLNPREYRVVALGKPSEVERGQWYFQRYVQELPNAGEMVFFDRSWYNRAVVEPVMGFCTPEQHQLFMKQVNPFEKMLLEDGIIFIKFWFSIQSQEQSQRIKERLESPLKQWKVSPVDMAAQDRWDDFTLYKNKMFKKTSTTQNPWMIVQSESREEGRIEAMRHVLSLLEYDGKSENLRGANPVKVFQWTP